MAILKSQLSMPHSSKFSSSGASNLRRIAFTSFAKLDIGWYMHNHEDQVLVIFVVAIHVLMFHGMHASSGPPGNVRNVGYWFLKHFTGVSDPCLLKRMWRGFSVINALLFSAQLAFDQVFLAGYRCPRDG